MLTDPTGAGDVFGGAALAALAGGASLEEAARWGSATASFVVEAFGAARLWEIERADVERRAATIPRGGRPARRRKPRVVRSPR